MCCLLYLVPGVGLFPSDKPVKEDVNKALHLAKKSTASIGKFTESLPKEKPTKNMGKKRKVEKLCFVHQQIITPSDNFVMSEVYCFWSKLSNHLMHFK